MCTAAEFQTEIPHFHNAYRISIFFSEKRHGTEFLRLINWQDPCRDIIAVINSIVYNIFYCTDFLFCHCLHMVEVKTQPFRRYARASLMHMFSEHHAKCFLQQVRSTVVPLRSKPSLTIHRHGSFFAGANRAVDYRSDMSPFSIVGLRYRIYADHTAFRFNRPLVSCLSAALRIKCRFIRYQNDIVTYFCFRYGAAIRTYDIQDFSFCNLFFITFEDCFRALRRHSNFTVCP